MTKEQAEFFINALEYNGIEAELREDYSGRGMYGKTTFAVVTEKTHLIISAILRYLPNLEPEEYVELPDFSNFTLKQDSMGLGVILY